MLSARRVLWAGGWSSGWIETQMAGGDGVPLDFSHMSTGQTEVFTSESKKASARVLSSPALYVVIGARTQLETQHGNKANV